MKSTLGFGATLLECRLRLAADGRFVFAVRFGLGLDAPQVMGLVLGIWHADCEL
jgi:hypothetical protein